MCWHVVWCVPHPTSCGAAVAALGLASAVSSGPDKVRAEESVGCPCLVVDHDQEDEDDVVSETSCGLEVCPKVFRWQRLLDFLIFDFDKVLVRVQLI